MAFAETVALAVGAPLALNADLKKVGLSERSLAYVETMLFGYFGKPAEELRGEHHWVAAERELGKVQGWLGANGEGKDSLLMGDRVCFADFQLAAILLSTKIMYGEDSEEWKRVCGWHGGKWERYLKQFEPYMAVDE